MDEYEQRFKSSTNLLLLNDLNKLKRKIIRSSELMRDSSENLKASTILYEHECYPEAIYLFQQSVEKATKAFGIITYSINNPKESGHNTPSVWSDALKVSKFRGKQNNEMIKASQIFQNKQKQIIEDYKSYVKPNDAELEKVNDILEKMNKHLQNATIIDASGFEKTASDIDNITRKSKLVFAKLTKGQIADFMYQWGLKANGEHFMGLRYLFPLGVLTYPHANTTRYKEKQIGPSDYKPGLGIVDIYPELALTATLALRDINRLITRTEVEITTETQMRKVFPKKIANIIKARKELEAKELKLSKLKEQKLKSENEIKEMDERRLQLEKGYKDLEEQAQKLKDKTPKE